MYFDQTKRREEKKNDSLKEEIWLESESKNNCLNWDRGILNAQCLTSSLFSVKYKSRWDKSISDFPRSIKKNLLPNLTDCFVILVLLIPFLSRKTSSTSLSVERSNDYCFKLILFFHDDHVYLGYSYLWICHAMSNRLERSVSCKKKVSTMFEILI